MQICDLKVSGLGGLGAALDVLPRIFKNER